jgi:hypothetical protein
VLAGRPRTSIVTAPSIEHVADVCAVGIRVDLSQKAAIRSLANVPGIAFEHKGWYRGKWQPHFIAAWRFERPIAPKEAERVEKFLAERFRRKPDVSVEETRLNFFIPVPKDRQPQDFAPRFIDPKDIEELLKWQASADDEELSADCAPEPAAFAIEPVAERGTLTLVSGDAGMGKSQIVLHFAMCMTRGIGLPGQPAPQICAALVNELEDNWRRKVVPRLIANGANRKLIKSVSVSNLHTQNGVAKLDSSKKRFEDETGLPVGLLVLSPYMACFGGGSNQEAHMRDKLSYFSKWMESTDIAAVGVAHLDESGAKPRVAGPATHRRLARASWQTIKDEATGQRLFVCDKANNTADDFKLAYRIQGMTVEGGIRTSRIIWEDMASAPISAVEPMAQRIAFPPKPKLSATVMQYAAALQEIMTPGGAPLNGTDVKREMRKRLMTNQGALYEAADALRIERGSRNGRTESAPWIPPSQWPTEYDLALG